MYKFIDTTEIAESTLPAEALQINGQYIEDLIAGYRTLSVSGRESLSAVLDTYETGVRDGATLKNRRYPARTIIVKYQLIADSNAAFRAAYNKLGGILNVENAKLIFNDENDKYYIGTPASIGEVEPGRNAVTSEFEIVCADPFKYSVIEYEAIPQLDESSVLIDYNGTYKAYPVLEADFYSEPEILEDGTSGALTGAGDCGYVAFFNEDAKIIQLGNPEEVDGVEVEKPQTLMNQLFTGQYAWGDTAKALWAVNAAPGLFASVTQNGSVGIAVADYVDIGKPASTSGNLVDGVVSRAEEPYVVYSATAVTSARTANSVKVKVAVTGRLDGERSYFATAGVLKASVFMGGEWHSCILKSAGSYWRGTSAHTVNMTFIVSGLTATQTALTGIKFKVERTDTIGSTGVLDETVCNDLPISAYYSETPETYCIAPTTYGSGNKWHGVAITRKLSADSNGEVGASEFVLTYKQKMGNGAGSGDKNQRGAFEVVLTDADGVKVAGVRIRKTGTSPNAIAEMYVNGKNVHNRTIGMIFSSNNSFVPSSKITKSGSNVTFSIGNVTKTFVDDAIADTMVTDVTFAFEAYADYPALTYNGLYWAKFVKNNCKALNDVPNKFSANDILEADCKSGEVYLNGVHSPDLGALGNDWEDFCLTPGLNQIGVAYSDWVADEYAPTLKVRYREVFL